MLLQSAVQTSVSAELSHFVAQAVRKIKPTAKSIKCVCFSASSHSWIQTTFGGVWETDLNQICLAQSRLELIDLAFVASTKPSQIWQQGSLNSPLAESKFTKPQVKTLF